MEQNENHNGFLVYMTAPTEQEALHLARELVRLRLAAGVNMLPAARSVYRWQGKVEQAGEWLLLAKTTRDRLDALSARVVALHPYELPEVLAVEATGGLPAYLDWIAANTRPGAHE